MYAKPSAPLHGTYSSTIVYWKDETTTYSKLETTNDPYLAVVGVMIFGIYDRASHSVDFVDPW